MGFMRFLIEMNQAYDLPGYFQVLATSNASYLLGFQLNN